ncbi:MAG: transposase [Deltaproteobacteria bacterium]|nr:transposase [Deltaproteobacteria bacterium]
MAKRSTKVQHVGIDVSAKTLQVAMDGSDGVRDLEFSNDADGHKKLCKVLTKKGLAARVCLEATGNYSLDAAIALSAAEGVEVMIVNPKSARHFAEAQLRRAKTDRVDARALMDYAQRMPFVVWARPSRERLHLRQIARRISSLIEETTAEKNRLAAAQATGETPKLVLCDIEEGSSSLSAASPSWRPPRWSSSRARLTSQGSCASSPRSRASPSAAPSGSWASC